MRFFTLILYFSLINFLAFSQEFSVPLMGNASLQKIEKEATGKKMPPMALPFFDDFSSFEKSPYPRKNRWDDSSVFVNNNFSQLQKNKGVATFDIINKYGIPYNEHPYYSTYCDTLTSRKILLNGLSASNNVYLSFQYECGGLGFMPKQFDSLLIYFNDSINGWTLVDYIKVDSSEGFKSKIIKVENPNYFHSNFQFRIINRGTIGTSGSHWNIDNVYLNSGRNDADTFLNDIAFTLPTANLLNDYTSMPFKHFSANRNLYTADYLYAPLHNSYPVDHSVTVNFSAINKLTGANYGFETNNVSVMSNTDATGVVSLYNVTALSAGGDKKLMIDQKYYFTSPGDDFSKSNDTITHTQVFDNYFAYDDGSAEQSYFLKLSEGAAGKIAMEFHNQVKDTFAGIAIQFAPQVPNASYKEFFIQIYKSIQMGGPGGDLIYEQPFNYPGYGDSANAFKIYPLDELVALDTGIFYVVIMMPAGGVSDSLMIGLDKNRIGGNHRYYSVYDEWNSSILEGALMIRPIMGNEKILNLAPNEIENKISIFPNPTTHYLNISNSSDEHLNYSIFDLTGKNVLRDFISDQSDMQLDISHLNSGVYIIKFQNDKGINITKKFLKK